MNNIEVTKNIDMENGFYSEDLYNQLESIWKDYNNTYKTEVLNIFINNDNGTTKVSIAEDDNNKLQLIITDKSTLNSLSNNDSYSVKNESVLHDKNKIKFHSFHKKEPSDKIQKELKIRTNLIALLIDETYKNSYISNELLFRTRAESLLHGLSKRTANKLEQDFLITLVKALHNTLKIKYAFVTECTDSDKTRVRTLSIAKDGKIVDNIEYDLAGTPCDIVMKGEVYTKECGLEKEFPREEGLESYIGVPLYLKSELIGHIAIADDKEFKIEKYHVDVLELFSSRAAVEIERMKLRNSLNDLNAKLENKVELRTKELSDEIVERKKIEVQLEQAKVVAESANNAKSEFLANMSHELRTPLNGILGYTQLLKSKDVDNEMITKGVNVIDESGKHLLTLINDLLDLSRIEAGKVEYDKSEMSLKKLLKSMEVLFLPNAENKEIDLKFVVDDSVPELICSDERKIRQILLNLISNAIKFTDSGSVNVCVKSDGSGNITIAVKDSGSGINKKNIKEIFNPFYQVKNNKSSKLGTGLGLSISKKLCDVLKGSISVSSKINKGSEFKLSFPYTTNENNSVRKTEDQIIYPDKDTLTLMYSASLRGDVEDIKKHLDEIDNSNNYKTFVGKVNESLDTFDLKTIKDFLKKEITNGQ